MTFCLSAKATTVHPLAFKFNIIFDLVFLPIEKPEFWLPLAYVNGDVRLLRTSATYFLQ